MAITGLKSAVNPDFVLRFQALAQSGDSSAAGLAKALKGGGDSTPAVQSALRFGARIYSTAVQGINLGASFINLATADLTRIKENIEKMKVLAERATSNSIGRQTRRDLSFEFQGLAGQIETIVESAKFGDSEYLSTSGLTETFINIGLDPEKSTDVGEIFDQFNTSAEDDFLFSEHTTGTRPIRLPAGMSGRPSITTEGIGLFDVRKTIDRQADAYLALADLEGMEKQIDDNLKALDDMRDILGKNLTLIRVTGLAMLEVSDEIKGYEEADDVARLLRGKIRKSAGQALSQLENLDPLAIAALTFDSSEFN